MKDLLLFVFLLNSQYPLLGDVIDLQIQVSGFRNNKGQACIRVFTSESQYEKRQAHDNLQKCHPIAKKQADFEFDLSHSPISIAVLHDEDGNHEMTTNWLGMPKEGFGFSNNAKGKFGPPKYEKTLIILKNPQHLTRIRMEYF